MKSFVFILFLPLTFCSYEQYFCSDAQWGDTKSFCHPNTAGAYITCSNDTKIHATTSLCDPNYYYSTIFQTCVYKEYSDCAAILLKVNPFADACNSQTKDAICHPTEPESKFIYCHRNSNRELAAPVVFACPKGMSFSEKLGRCTEKSKSDCLPSSNIIGPGPGKPRSPLCHLAYRYLPDDKVTWGVANLKCRQLGGFLASINNPLDQHSVDASYGLTNGQPSPFWIGLNDFRTKGDFKWTTGLPVGISRWQNGRPNNDRNNHEHCVVFNYRNDRAKWGDVDCASHYGYLCEVLVCPHRIRAQRRRPHPAQPPVESKLDRFRNRLNSNDGSFYL